MSEVSFTHGRYRLEWVDIGEGYDGDYNPNDPNDKPLYRADLYADGDILESGSYCTGAPVATDPEILEGMARDLFRDLPDNPTQFRHRVMQNWTWRTLL